jgi:hypothetical protein
MAMYSFVSPFREAKFCGVPSYIFDKLGCAAGEKYLRNTAISNSFNPWNRKRPELNQWRTSKMFTIFVELLSASRSGLITFGHHSRCVRFGSHRYSAGIKWRNVNRSPTYSDEVSLWFITHSMWGHGTAQTTAILYLYWLSVLLCVCCMLSVQAPPIGESINYVCFTVSWNSSNSHRQKVRAPLSVVTCGDALCVN